MKDKTKEQLTRELAALRQRVTELEAAKAERKWAEEEIQRKTQDLTLINSLNDAANRGDSLQEIIQLLSNETAKMASGGGVTVYLVSEDKEYLVMQNLVLPPAMANRIEKLVGIKIPTVKLLLKAGSLYLETLQTGKPLLINDPATIQRLMAEFTETVYLPGEPLRQALQKIIPQIHKVLGIQSVMIVPLVSEGEAIGLLDISNKEPFTKSDLRRLETISGQLTAVIKRKQAEMALHRQAAELTALQATVLDITTPHDLPTLLQDIVERAVLLLNAPSGGMYSCDPDQEQVRCVVSYKTPSDYTGIVLKYGEGAAGIVAQTGEPLVIDDYRTWDKRAAAYEEEQPFTAILTVPMIWQGQVTGALTVVDDAENRRFTPADQELLILFANHAAVAIENTRLYEQAQKEIAERVQAEATLRESERFLQNIFDAIQDGISVLDCDLTILRVNSWMEKVYAAEMPLVGKKCYAAYQKKQSPCPWCPSIPTIETGEVHTEIVPYPSAEKPTGWINLSAFPLQDTDGRVGGIIEYAKDITERKQAEKALQRKARQQEQLIETARYLTASLDVKEVLTRIGVGAKEILSAHGCAIYLLEENGKTLTPVVAIEPPYEEDILSTPLDIEASFTGQAVKTRRGLIFNDARTDFSGQQIPGTPEEEKEHIIVAPFVAGDEVLGAMCLNRIETLFSEEDLALAETFATYAATALKNAQVHHNLQREVEERRQAEEALRESEERYRAIFEQAADSVVLIDAETGALVEFNDRAHKNLGYTREELKNLRIPDFEVIESDEEVAKRIEKIVEGGADTFETRHRTKGGDVRNILVSTRAISVHGRDFIQGIWRDITERVRAEQLLQALNQVSLAMQQALTPREIFTAVAETFKELGFTCMILPTDESQSKLFTRYLGIDAPLVTAAEKLVGLSHQDFSIPIENVDAYQEVVWERKTVFVEDVEEIMRQVVPGFAKRFARRLVKIVNFPTVTATPLIVEDKVIGVLSVQSGDLTENDAPAITAFAHQVAAAWRKAELFEQAQREIAERKRAEKERTRLLAQIQEQARQVQQIIDTVPEGVLLLDADGQVVLANPVAEGALSVLAGVSVGDTLTHLSDRPLAELLTSPPKGLWHEMTTDGPSPRTFEIIARPIETGPTPSGACPATASTTASTRGGARGGEPVEGARPEPVEGARPEPVEGWVLVVRDVTQEREIERRIQQQERLATVGQLAAGIAHDFNNIMATIVLYAQMSAGAEGVPDRVRERMVTINQQARHATRLIQQILDFSRRAVLKRQPLDLSPLLKEQIKLLERTLPESIEIDLAYGRDEYTVKADPTRIQQAITNLAVNARDAMPEGGNLHIGLERIAVRPGESPPLSEMKPGEWVQVTVLDTGIGIPPDDLPHVFDPFFTTKAPGRGTGLGLAQVHGIVTQHEGYIDVESQLGHGTTFTIYLPALAVDSAEPLAIAALKERPSFAKGQAETILVVEDDRITREALVDSLVLLNYRTLEAAEGREALAILEEYGDEIALVLSDVVMPGMGGIALLHTLRERGLMAGVVMLTGHPLEKELENLRAQEMIDWLLKPPSLEQLAEVVARALKEGQTDA